ncbi:metal ABC transporter permease [Streptomyces sp. NPDC002039]|uniref:metal ABC transporter permease n=1 Tax=unclassified Streptomyces TaxID=2593676 RepID=UPI00099D0804|nr:MULTISPECIES: metal ABC transporter permease [unclassified Streptomyces]MCX5075506.1 metal ABC transporter permease [Streptomyces sp. NBC_00424]MCY0918198.1 metal ABC transporter permease [Streptomyces sp. H27-G5]MCY0962297.1 metal ABC transporter permease [Streptomyces sp. H27-H5]WUD41387.1 metal ABC transporter permease [Streptomyces sp. NBC_00513]
MDLLTYPFMVRALIAAGLVGLTAPAIGTYLVQRRQAVMGDGLGHVAMTGVALGFVLHTSPVWMATLVAVVGAVGMELIRSRGRTSGDVALAMLFYGGLAGGVMIINLGGGSTTMLLGSMFGSITTVASEDVIAMVILAAFVLAVTIGLRRQLFAVCQDEEFARVTGLPVRALNLLIAITAAVTVTVAMRIVGLLLVSAMMVIPVAAAQRMTRGFATTLGLAIAISVTVALTGTAATYYVEAPSGAMIVLLAIAVFMVMTALSTPLARRRAKAARSAEEVCTRDDVKV